MFIVKAGDVKMLRDPFLHFPRATLCVLLAACGISVWMANLEVDTEMDDLLSGDQRNLQSYETAQEVLGETIPIAVSLDCGEVYSPAGLELIREMTWELGKVPGAVTEVTNVQGQVFSVTNVHSLVTAQRPVRQGFGLAWENIVPFRLDAADMSDLRHWSQDHPYARNILVAENGRHTVILANYTRPLVTPEEQAVFDQEIGAVLEQFRQRGHSVNAIGLPLIEHEIRTAVKADAVRFVPTALGLLLVVLAFTFRRTPRLMVYVLANQVMGLVLLPALYQLSGLQLNIFTVLLVPLLSAVHLTLLTHVATSFQRAWLAGEEAMVAVNSMGREVLRASGFAALTTITGLLALQASDVEQLREFGVLGASGIAMLFGLTFGPGLAWLPVLFSKRSSDDEPAPEHHSEANRFDWSGWADRMQAMRQPMAVFLVLSGVLMVVGLSQVRTDVRAVEFLNRASPTRVMIEEMDDAYGGINVVQVQVDSGMTNGLNNPYFLQYLDSMHQMAAREPGVTAVYSYTQLMAAINEVWEGGREGTFRLPENPLMTALFSGLVASQKEQLPFLTMLCDTNFQTAQLTLRTRDMPSSEYLEILEQLETEARMAAPTNVTVSAENGIRSILEADQRIVRSQRRSVGWAVGVIGVILAVLWRSVGLALLALAVNLLPVGMIISLQGFAGVPLNSITIMVAAIALGVAVDDTIHFITHWRDKRRTGSSPTEATRSALQVKGRPIVATTIILAGMMMVFWMSVFPPVVHFGLLLAVGLAGALLATLVLLPVWLGQEEHK
ncbi:MAG: hypothetical protein CMO67_00040 [Verrucomicrobiales bacterium]|nr:hypothetical protein [Verrucomicrobiales bacterium]